MRFIINNLKFFDELRGRSCAYAGIMYYVETLLNMLSQNVFGIDTTLNHIFVGINFPDVLVPAC